MAAERAEPDFELNYPVFVPAHPPADRPAVAVSVLLPTELFPPSDQSLQPRYRHPLPVPNQAESEFLAGVDPRRVDS